MRRLPRTFMCLAATAFGFAPRTAPAESTFERFAHIARTPRYQVRLETHEELGDRSEDATLRYRHAPNASELRVLEGRGAGARMTIVNGRLTVYAAPFLPGIGRRIALDDPGVTSLRGNGIGAADLASLASCFASHVSSLREMRGPEIDGRPTTAVVFDRRGDTCPNDSKVDRAITADVLYLATDTGTPVMRKRFIGREIVEQWRIRDFAIDSAD